LNRATVSVVSGDLAPNSSVLGFGLQRLGSVNISHSLTQVELGILLGAYSFNLEDGVVGSLVTLSLGVASYDSSSVQTAWFTCSVNTS